MCRTRKQIAEETPIIQEVDSHLSRNKLESTERLMLRLIKENHIRQIQVDEKQEERSRYPSLLYLMFNKPRMFFPLMFAFLISFILLADPIVVTRIIEMAGGSIKITSENYASLGLPAIMFFTITGIIGAASYKE